MTSKLKDWRIFTYRLFQNFVIFAFQPSSRGLSVPESFEYASKGNESGQRTLPTELDEPLSNFEDFRSSRTTPKTSSKNENKSQTENKRKRSIDNYYLNQVMTELGWSECIQAPLPNEINLSIVDEMTKTSEKIGRMNRDS